MDSAVAEWFDVDAILAVNRGELPDTARSLYRYIQGAGWQDDTDRARKKGGRGGGWIYHVSILPAAIQVRLTHVEAEAACEISNGSRVLWERYELLSKAQKAIANQRFEALILLEEKREAGHREVAAVRAIAKQAEVSVGTVYNWKSLIENVDRSDWLAALAPEARQGAKKSGCDPRAWAALKSDFLRPEKPSFSACYRRMKNAAADQGWSPIARERALRRRLDKEVPVAVQQLAREGKDRAKPLYPAQKRSRDHFHAMQAVNMDGHKFDVFVEMPDGRIIRPMLVALQDLYSNKFVGWRLSDSENKETVRLTIGDMVEQFGIPEKIFLDNGRAFASKWITGGTKTRFRFKVRDEEPTGLLTTLGVKVVWTTPYSGQSKPIERAFRDLSDSISRHPICAGAWTGNRTDNQPENRGSKAVPFELFKELVDTGIAEHNARDGRNTQNAKGRSFDATFQDSLSQPGTIVRWPTQSQRHLWLLVAEEIRANRGNGEIRLHDNRYWHPALTGWAGKKLVVRFDPQQLHRELKIYDPEDRFICNAECFHAAGFDDVDAARVHNRKRAAWFKSVSDQQKLQRELTAAELARIYETRPIEKPDTSVPPTKVTRLVTAGATAISEEADWDEQDDENFSKALRIVGGSEFEV